MGVSIFKFRVDWIGSVNGSANFIFHWYEFNCAVYLYLLYGTLYAIFDWNDPSRGESRTKENSHKWPRARERQVVIIAYITKENTIA